jgi:hypothetical protein
MFYLEKLFKRIYVIFNIGKMSVQHNAYFKRGPESNFVRFIKKKGSVRNRENQEYVELNDLNRVNINLSEEYKSTIDRCYEIKIQ